MLFRSVDHEGYAGTLFSGIDNGRLACVCEVVLFYDALQRGGMRFLLRRGWTIRGGLGKMVPPRCRAHASAQYIYLLAGGRPSSFAIRGIEAVVLFRFAVDYTYTMITWYTPYARIRLRKSKVAQESPTSLSFTARHSTQKSATIADQASPLAGPVVALVRLVLLPKLS